VIPWPLLIAFRRGPTALGLRPLSAQGANLAFAVLQQYRRNLRVAGYTTVWRRSPRQGDLLLQSRPDRIMLGFAVHKITEKIRGVVAKARRDNSTFGVTWRTTMRSTVLRCLAFATIFGLQWLSTNVSALPVGLTWKDTQPAGDKTTGLAAASSSSQSHGPYTVADKAFGMYGAIFQDPVLGRVGRL
jgi:hypothetical protein